MRIKMEIGIFRLNIDGLTATLEVHDDEGGIREYFADFKTEEQALKWASDFPAFVHFHENFNIEVVAAD